MHSKPVVSRAQPADTVNTRMTRRVETTGDRVGGRHHVWHRKQQRSHAHHNCSEADPAGNMASTTQVAHDYGRQYAANLDRGGDQTRERAADLKAFLNRCNDTVNVAGSQRS